MLLPIGMNANALDWALRFFMKSKSYFVW